jgi:hypothetical protein
MVQIQLPAPLDPHTREKSLKDYTSDFRLKLEKTSIFKSSDLIWLKRKTDWSVLIKCAVSDVT